MCDTEDGTSTASKLYSKVYEDLCYSPAHPKGNQPWILIGRTDAEAPILWPHDANIWLTGKDPDAEKDGGQEEKGTTEDEMVGWHHWFNRHEFEQALRDTEGQGGLACCSPWGRKESDTAEWLKSNNSFILDLRNFITHPKMLLGNERPEFESRTGWSRNPCFFHCVVLNVVTGESPLRLQHGAQKK